MLAEERQIAEAIKPGNDEGCLDTAAALQRLGLLGAAVLLPTLNLDKFRHQLPRSAVQIIDDGLLLGIEAEGHSSLPISGNPVGGDELLDV